MVIQPASKPLSVRSVHIIADLLRKEQARRHPGHLAEYAFGLKPEPFHWEWLDLSMQYDRGVLKAARGHAKSTMFSVVRACWRVGNDPNVRLAIGSATAGQAEKFLREIGYHIQHNPLYRAVFGDLFDPDAVWTQKQKTVKRTKILKDSTFLAVGVGTGFAGARTDEIILDDLVDDTNSLTVGRRRHVMDWVLNTALPSLDPTGSQTAWLIGTPYHFDDATMHLAGIWPSWVYPAEDRDGNILWPSRFTRRELDRRRLEMGEYGYRTQYLCEPVGVEGNRLLRAWLHESSSLPKGKELEVWGVDTAVVPESEDEVHERDHSVIAKFRIRAWGLELFDLVRLQVALPDLIAFIAGDLHPRVAKVGMEINGVGRPAFDLLRQKTTIPLEPIISTGSKLTRMELMAPDWAAGRMTLALDRTERCAQFVNEWLGFPFYQGDDCLDAADMARRAYGLGASVSLGSANYG